MPTRAPCFKFARVSPRWEIRQSLTSSRLHTAGKNSRPWRLGWNIFHAVDGQIDILRQQRFLQFLDEDSLAADLRQRSLLHFVARGLDNDDFGFHAGDLEQLLAHEFRLPARQNAASTANAQRPHGFSRSDRYKSRSASTF